MIKKFITYSLIFVFVVLALTYYNYQKQQTNLRGAKQTQFSIEFGQIPDSLTANQYGSFSWRVSAPESFSTRSTGIYWNYESSPSALTKFDSPLAAGYHNFTEDYASGLFKLPDTFDLNMRFPKAGIVYLRAYALIDNDYLWTQEKQIVVNKPL